MRWWRLGRLRTRMILSFALVLVAGQGIGYWLVDAASGRNARSQLEQELVAGERVFARLLEHNRNQLAQAATVLAADYGFREAIATRDGETLVSVLDNHGERIKASTMQLISLDGIVLARAGQTGPGQQPPANTPVGFAMSDLLDAARVNGSASAIVSQGERPSQIVVVPVRAPVLTAWVAVGFEIDDLLARDINRLTDLEVSFVRADARGSTIFASTLQGDPRRSLKAAITAAGVPPGGSLMKLGGVTYGTRVVSLGGVHQPALSAVLQRSLDEKLAAFSPLRQFLVVLALTSVTVSILCSALLARGITRPLHLLQQGAMRMRSGDYSAPISIRQADEIGVLADSFNGMREEIASREKEILRLAYQDSLTGLPNRARFNEQLAQAMQAGCVDAAPLAVLMLGLDRFKLINDTLGHAAGDHVLRQMALRLRQLAPAHAMVARLGGDEFAVLVPGSGDTGPGSEAQAERLALLVLEMMKHPVLFNEQPLDVGGSIGIARYPQHGTDAGTLVRNADMAMYGAKRGSQGYAFFDLKFDVAQQDHLSLLGELRRAVESDELRVHYQPKIDLAKGVTKGVEALVRWQHASRGLVPPALFMPYAEQTGFVRHVTKWMLDRSIAQCGRWFADGLALQVSINISTRDLLDVTLPGLVGRLLVQNAVPARLICLEITESSFMEDPERALATLHEIDALGVEISIDDFGTGFSSLAYLKKLPVDELKIDRAFVKNMLEDPDDFIIVRSTVELAHNLGLRVVAEGVETAEAMGALTRIGCDLAQGYHASRPVPPDELLDWLARSPWGLPTGGIVGGSSKASAIDEAVRIAELRRA